MVACVMLDDNTSASRQLSAAPLALVSAHDCGRVLKCRHKSESIKLND